MFAYNPFGRFDSEVLKFFNSASYSLHSLQGKSREIPRKLPRSHKLNNSKNRRMELGNLGQNLQGWLKTAATRFVGGYSCPEHSDHRSPLLIIERASKGDACLWIFRDHSKIREMLGLKTNVVKRDAPVLTIKAPPSVISPRLQRHYDEGDNQSYYTAECLDQGSRDGQRLLKVPHRRSPLQSRHQRARTIALPQGLVAQALELSAAE